MKGLVAGLAMTCLFTAGAAMAAGDTPFSDEEKLFVLSHGPWPPEPSTDPSNRFSGDADAIAFGRDLFRERLLSKARVYSCAGCHDPGNHFADGREKGLGEELLDRHTIALANLRQHRWFGWDGGNDTLWGQSIRPITNPAEMNLPAKWLARRFAETERLAKRYRTVTGKAVAAEPPETVLVTVGKILAAFQETIITPRTEFDDFRDAMARGDRGAMARYPAAARRGLRIFIGKGNCAVCHFGANFTNGEFHSIGLPHFAAPGRVDPGRHGGLKRFRENPYRRDGRFSDEKPAASPPLTSRAARQHRNWGEFRVPSLRNIANTAPYMHDGSLATLADVVDHYSELNMERLHTDGEALLRPLNLSRAEKDDLIAFLKSLSGAPASQ